MKPGAMLAHVPVRSQMQYGSREARQALQREKKKKKRCVRDRKSIQLENIYHESQ